ncbi:hypothetical protein Trydic_g2495 [Trypoxylus dichotomus]
MILNAFCYFNKTVNVFAAAKETSKALGCKELYVPFAHKEHCNPHRRKNQREKNTRMLVYDTQVQTPMRGKVHCFVSNIPPTLNRILTSVNMDNDIPNFKRTTLYKLMLDIGFVFE